MMKKKCLYLDEKQIPLNLDDQVYNPWVTVRDGDAFVKYIKENPMPDLISMAHDLAEEHYNDFYKNQAQDIHHINYDSFKISSGYHLMRWLIYYCLKNDVLLPVINVHSQNVLGKENMVKEANTFYAHQGQQMMAGDLPLQTIELNTKIIS
jgi:hypothetical protein